MKPPASYHWEQVGKVSGGECLMEKIVLVCREPENHAQMIALVEDMFPECTVEILAKPSDELDFLSGPLENMGSSFHVFPYSF